MPYQNINQYNFSKIFLIPVNEITDISLVSDEKDFDSEVVFSQNIIGYNDGRRLPINIEIFDSGCTNFSDHVLVSKNYWGQDTPISASTISLCNIGLTGIDNGLVNSMSGETIEINNSIYTNPNEKFSKLKFDKRMKFNRINGFTTPQNRIFNDNSYNYNISFDVDNEVGYYARLNGGFYQGFYKLFGYDYEVYPERVEDGWTAEFILRPRFNSPQSVGLNARYSGNTGMFFYLGARAENKFYHYPTGSPLSLSSYTRVTSGLTCLYNCECTGNTSGNTCNKIYPDSEQTNPYYLEKDPLYDSMSNGLGIRLSGTTGNPRLCVKTFTLTGACDSSNVYQTGVTLNEWCSSRGIFEEFKDTNYIGVENWAQIDIVFKRYKSFEDCDLKYYGGLYKIKDTKFVETLKNNTTSLIEPPITHDTNTEPEKVDIYQINKKWLADVDNRLGRLKIYVNGKPFMIIENFEEIIPRPLNASKETQLSVPFNISIGGGTQGLHDNLTFSACTSGGTYQQDPELLPTEILNKTQYSGLTTNIFLEQYFGGSFIGDISVFRMYTIPLDASQVRHNFRLVKDKYNLINPLVPDCLPAFETFFLLTENNEVLRTEDGFNIIWMDLSDL